MHPEPRAYYNEIDPYAAEWLRNLIAAGHIAPGIVDTRSIADIEPADLAGFTQVHFFAGIGGWSLAARLAGWADSRPLWTGSCPCQPFSVAGKGAGQDDKRHLWPEFHRLIRGCRPPVVMGEQVAAAVGKSWLDGVCSDLERIDYATGAVVVPACAVDAPHRRDRLWFVADRDHERRGILEELEQPQGDGVRAISGQGTRGRLAIDSGAKGCLAHADEPGLAEREGHAGISREGRGEHQGQDTAHVHSALAPAGPMADAAGINDWRRTSEPHARSELKPGIGGVQNALVDTDQSSAGTRWEQRSGQFGGARGNPRSSAWHDSTLAVGADGKARRVKPGIRLLAHGIPARVGKLRAFGNAIVPQVAAEIIGAYMDCCQG